MQVLKMTIVNLSDKYWIIKEGGDKNISEH